MLLNGFRDFMVAAVTGGSVTYFNNANSYIAVGDSSAAEAATQTDLQATTNKLRKAMDATYPQVSGNVATFRATFGTGDANWAWNEWGVVNASSGGTYINRKVGSYGTKSSAETKQVTATITFTV